MVNPAEQHVTTEEAAAFRARWRAVDELLRSELRSLPIETKLKQLNTLLRTARRLRWTRSDDESEVRERWVRLRRALHG